MKNLKLGISALALTIASTVFAQTTNNPWLIGVGAHGVNHAAAGGDIGNVFSTLTGSGDNGDLYRMNSFTITPPLSKLTVARNLSKFLVLDWQTSVGNVDNKRIGMGKEFFLMTGLGLQFKFNGFWNEESWFDPYVRVGGNYLRHDYSGVTFPLVDNYGNSYPGFSDFTANTQRRKDHMTLSTGLGSNFWITKNFGLGVQGDYVSTPTDKSDIANFWQASASILFRFGNTDRDKDGILDKDDACPDVFGLAEFQGCPDTDGDGVPDKDDQCPDVAGPVENNGCPWPDTDGDGVLDKDDACPTVPGLPEYNGCPKPTAVAVTEEFKDLLFDFNKATIQPGSTHKLDKAAEIIKSAPAENFVVVGTTDAKGSVAYNLNLSRQRAAAVVKALEARGVNPAQLKSIGIGSQEATVPATASDAERQVDRKVIVRAISGGEWAAMKKSDVPAPAKKAPAKKAKKK